MGFADWFGSVGSTTPDRQAPGVQSLDLGFNNGGNSMEVVPANTPVQSTETIGGTSNQGTGLTGIMARASNQSGLLGMTPDNFSAVMGGMGAAISKKGSWQERLGTLAKGLGTTKLADAASKALGKGQENLLNEFFKANPGAAHQVTSVAGNPDNPLGPQPAQPDTPKPQ